MKQYYTIFSALLRPEIQEKISVGLLFMNHEEIYFRYSDQKLRAVKSLISDSRFQNTQEYAGYHRRRVYENGPVGSKKESHKFSMNSELSQLFSASYIDYLSRYSNNLLVFSAPKELMLDFNEQNFSVLYRRFIDNVRST